MSDIDTPTLPPAAVPPASREEIIQKVAQTIIARRQERDLTLEKVTQTIKIRIFYLQAIEKGKWEDLPGEVYVRGFIKRYANFLGLDGETLMAPYIAFQSPASGEPPFAAPSSASSSSPKPKASQAGSEVNRLQFLWIGVIGIFIVVFIKLIQKERTAPLNSISTVAAPVVTSSATSTATAVAPVSARAVLDKHSIEVYSPYPLWLRVATTDKTFEGFIPQAASWTWKGAGTFNVRLGHTKQVSLSFDGQPVALTEDQRAVTLPHAN